MAQGSNQLLLCSELVDRGNNFCSVLNDDQILMDRPFTISSRVTKPHCGAGTYRLPNADFSVANNQYIFVESSLNGNRRRDEEFGVKYNRLLSIDSGVSCRCNHFSCSSTEDASNVSVNDKQGIQSRRKTVSFSLGSNTKLSDEQLCVTDIELDSDLDTDLDLTVDSTEATFAGQSNGPSDSHENHHSSRLSIGSTRGNPISNDNTAFKRNTTVCRERDGNGATYFRCDSYASQANAGNTIQNWRTSHDINVKTDHIPVFQHQQMPGPQCSGTTIGQPRLPQYLPHACHDHSHSDMKTIRCRCQSNIYNKTDRSFDLHSSAPLLQESCYVETRAPISTSQESRDLLQEAQVTELITRSAVSNTTHNKSINEKGVVAVPRPRCTKKAIKTCFVILMVFNIIALVAICYTLIKVLTDPTDHQCPLCKDVMDQVKGIKGATLNYSAFQEYINENEDGRCCLDHAFMFKLMVQTKSNPMEPSPYQTNIGESIIQILRNSTAKAAIHLQSMPFNDELDGNVSSGPIRWNFTDNISVGMHWDHTYNDSEIMIPLSGVYYIYAMVQYVYMNFNTNKHLESMQPVEDFPLSVSLYKVSTLETIHRRIGTVTLQCRFASQSIEHNSVIQKIVQLTKGDKVSLVVSNRQFLNNKRNIHQIGLFKVD
ncbi:hypothetical protein ACJMK2_018778 [Sinanodonta woodiana]|uniref:THD domain-containing protein n=1 Tax=Sinanodonta woodiana TaxID=1069815 RepID=A0ABD3UFX3_SINWO